MKNKNLSYKILIVVILILILGAGGFIYKEFYFKRAENIEKPLDKKDQQKSEVSIKTNKEEYQRDEEIEATLGYSISVYGWGSNGWSIQKWENNVWVDIQIKQSVNESCDSTPECKDVKKEIKNCPPIVYCALALPDWHKVEDTSKLVWDQTYKLRDDTYQCKEEETGKIRTLPCFEFSQVSSGKYKIRFEYTQNPDPNNPSSREVEIKYAEKEIIIN